MASVIYPLKSSNQFTCANKPIFSRIIAINWRNSYIRILNSLLPHHLFDKHSLVPPDIYLSVHSIHTHFRFNDNRSGVDMAYWPPLSFPNSTNELSE